MIFGPFFFTHSFNLRKGRRETYSELSKTRTLIIQRRQSNWYFKKAVIVLCKTKHLWLLLFLMYSKNHCKTNRVLLYGGVSSQNVLQFSSVQSLSRVQLFATPWIAACQASLTITNSRSLLKLRSIESVMASSHLILCRPLLLLPSIPPSIRVFSNESALRIRWPKYWSFSFSISPSKEHPGLISFRIDWLDLLAVQGTLKSLLQHHSSKASILSSQSNFHIHTWPLEKP